MVFHEFWLVPMVFQGGFMVYHDFWLVSIVFSRWFHGFSWFLVGFHGFVRTPQNCILAQRSMLWPSVDDDVDVEENVDDG